MFPVMIRGYDKGDADYKALLFDYHASTSLLRLYTAETCANFVLVLAVPNPD